MLYDRDFKRWKFSTDRVIETEVYQGMIDEYEEFRRKMLRVDIRDMNHELYGAPKHDENESAGSKIKNAVVTVLVLGAFVCCVLALILKKILLFGILFCSLFLVAGAILAFTGETNPKDSPSRRVRGRVIGVFIMLGAGAILSLILLRERFSQAELLIWMASVAFGLAGLCIIAIAIIDKLSAKIFYKEEIDAKCIGYVRMVDSDSDSDGGPPMTYMMISPVFEYSYEGQRIEAVYDKLQMGDCSDIELGSFTKIRINPNHPEDVLAPKVTSSANFAVLLIFGLIFTLVGSGLAWYSLLGNAKGLTVETSWNNILGEETSETTPSKKTISDATVEENYKEDIEGKPWYCEITTVSDIEDYKGNILLTFDDESFEKMLIKNTDALKKGDKIMLFYTVSRETEDQTAAYKCPFVYTFPADVEYTGSHGAYQP